MRGGLGVALATAAAAASNAASSNWPHIDRDGFRLWPRCTFQSIKDDNIDQFALTLLGGRVRNIAQTSCNQWSKPAPGECACAAPLSLLGNVTRADGARGALPTGGTFVEIGANDGLHMSNSFFFERQLGWRGMCVEASPATFRKLEANRPDCINVNALVGQPSAFNLTAEGEVAFMALAPAATGKEDVYSRRENAWESGISGIASLNRHSALKSEARAAKFAATLNKKYGRPKSGKDAVLAKKHMLKVRPFSELFATHGFKQIDFLSIDVEGAELQVLQSIDFRAVRVRLIAIESPTAQIRNLLHQQGFRNLRLNTLLGDSFFLHSSAASTHAEPNHFWRNMPRRRRGILS